MLIKILTGIFHRFRKLVLYSCFRQATPPVISSVVQLTCWPSSFFSRNFFEDFNSLLISPQLAWCLLFPQIFFWFSRTILLKITPRTIKCKSSICIQSRRNLANSRHSIPAHLLLHIFNSSHRWGR